MDTPEGNRTPQQKSAVCPPVPRAPAPAEGPPPGQTPPDDAPPWRPTHTDIHKHKGEMRYTEQHRKKIYHV